MTATKRAQILMEPDDYRRLEQIARRERVSVAELIRCAVRERFLEGPEDRQAAVESICDMNLPLISWMEVEDGAMEMHGGDVP